MLIYIYKYIYKFIYIFKCCIPYPSSKTGQSIASKACAYKNKFLGQKPFHETPKYKINWVPNIYEHYKL